MDDLIILRMELKEFSNREKISHNEALNNSIKNTESLINEYPKHITIEYQKVRLKGLKELKSEQNIKGF